jgi:cellulose synthase/poly-beta-1,6-N-acetylglucosamine synthase-like glycosyltransferase
MTAAVCILLLTSATVPCLYYAILFALGRCRRKHVPPGEPLHLTVVIPAHDEADQLPATLRSVFDADYPAGQLRVLVVADNCTDLTAEVANSHGAECVIRTDPTRRGKGYALAYGIPQALASTDAVIVLDADCMVNRDFLRRMSDRLRTADVVQSAVVSTNTDSPSGYVAAVGGTIDNATAAGLDALGGRVPLRGTGMGFRRGVLERHPWGGFGPTEDAEYAAILAADRVRVRVAAGAEVRCEAPAGGGAFAVQRRRWRSALGVGRFGLLNSKPLVLAHLFIVAIVVALLTTSPLLLGWLVLMLALTAGVYLAAVIPHGLPSVRVCGVVVRLLMLAVFGGRKQHQQWERTPRG